MADLRGASYLATFKPDGSDKRWLGQLGHVSQLKYGYKLPGGPDTCTALLSLPPINRPAALNPGRILRIYRGADYIWDGTLLEGVPGSAGWQLSARGSGNFGDYFRSIWSSYTADQPVNNAIALTPNGLRWVNPGIAGTPGIWLSQPQDSGTSTVTAHLNLITSNGGLTWYIGRYNRLSVFTLPNPFTTAASRLLVSMDPVARTITEDVNALYARFQATADSTTSGNSPATYGLTSATQPAGIVAHGRMEDFMDLSGAGVISSVTAQAAATAVLSKYQRANWVGPFTVSYGQLLTAGGTPVDLGCEQPGSIVKLMATDAGYGGEVIPGPVQFLSGQTMYDDDAELLTVTPFQFVTSDLASMISGITAALTPASA